MSGKSRRAKAERTALRQRRHGAWKPGMTPVIEVKRGSYILTSSDPVTPPVVDSTEEILAWRGWGLIHDPYHGTRLQSLSAKTIWDGPTLVADGDPSEEHRGVHAQTEGKWKQDLDPMWFVGADFRRLSFVEGVVALSGKVVVGATGYRAERATIQRLILRAPPPQWPEEETVPMPDLATRSACGNNYGGMSYTIRTYGLFGDGTKYDWPETVSFVTALRELAERYQCEVETAVEAIL